MRTRFERSWGYGFMAVLLAAVVATMAAGASAQSAPTEWSVPTFSSQPMNLAPDSEGNILSPICGQDRQGHH